MALRNSSGIGRKVSAPITLFVIGTARKTRTETLEFTGEAFKARAATAIHTGDGKKTDG